MQLLEQARAWLVAINPALPAVALVLVLWAPQAAMRRWLPGLWTRFAALGPQAQLARQLFQGLPSVVGGALLGALSAGGDPWEAATAALVGAVAPFWHHLLKALPFVPYDGELGKPKDNGKPPRGGKGVGLTGAALAFGFTCMVLSCSKVQSLTAADYYQAGLKYCAEVYPFLPAKAHTKEQDEACRQLSKVCTDTPMRLIEVEVEPVAQDAGADGDDTREKPATDAGNAGQ